MLEQRLRAWRFFEEMPWPTGREETWRRTRLTGFDLGAFTPLLGREPQSGPPTDAAAHEVAEASSGNLSLVDSARVSLGLRAEWDQKGVIFADLGSALSQHSEIVQRYFANSVAVDENKFSALHYALWNSGTLVYVPRGVTIDLPLQVVIAQAPGALAGFHHTLVVLEEGASLSLVEDWVGADGGLSNSVVELLAGAGSQLNYIHLQNLADTAWNFSTQRMKLGRDSRINYFIGTWGSRLTKAWINMELKSAGSHGELLGLYFPGGRQHVDLHTNQLHSAPNTTSDLLVKGALKDAARSVYQGYVKVFPGAQKTDAYQANRNLMLSPKARADSIPGLEIEADDIRCTHGASASQLPEEYVFYLMARGISRSDAERLIVQGFFEEVLQRIPVEGVRTRLEAEIAGKLGL
jgi:Fe-S cluster assembly protein SufD